MRLRAYGKSPAASWRRRIASIGILLIAFRATLWGAKIIAGASTVETAMSLVGLQDHVEAFDAFILKCAALAWGWVIQQVS